MSIGRVGESRITSIDLFVGLFSQTIINYLFCTSGKLKWGLSNTLWWVVMSKVWLMVLTWFSNRNGDVRSWAQGAEVQVSWLLVCFEAPENGNSTVMPVGRACPRRFYIYEQSHFSLVLKYLLNNHPYPVPMMPCCQMFIFVFLLL